VWDLPGQCPCGCISGFGKCISWSCGCWSFGIVPANSYPIGVTPDGGFVVQSHPSLVSHTRLVPMYSLHIKATRHRTSLTRPDRGQLSTSELQYTQHRLAVPLYEPLSSPPVSRSVRIGHSRHSGRWSRHRLNGKQRALQQRLCRHRCRLRCCRPHSTRPLPGR
jgi:hypothetical protein